MRWGGFSPPLGLASGRAAGSPARGGSIPLTPVNVTVYWGQSWGTSWARSNISEITAADRPNLSPSNFYIFNSPTQTIQALKLGPISGGGNEQQPSNAYMDAAYQNGLGWLAGYSEEMTVAGVTEEYIFGYAVGGSLYAGTGPQGVNSNWLLSQAGGAYYDMLADWNAFKVLLAAQGKTPNVVAVYTDLGESDAAGASYSTYATNHAATIAQMRTDIIGNAPIYQMRCSTRISTGRPNIASVRTDQQNMALADPTKFFLVNGDGAQLEAPPGFNTDDHPTAPWLFDDLGRRLALRRLGIAHPLRNIAELGDAIYCTRSWKFGSLTTFAGYTDFDRHVIERSNATPDLVANAGSTSAPALAKTTLGSGLVRRSLTFDGLNQFLRGGQAGSGAVTTKGLINQAGGFLIMGAVKGAASGQKNIFCECYSANSNPFWGLKVDGTGQLCITLRDDGATLRLNLAPLGTNKVIFDNAWHFFAVWYDGTTFTGQIDGTVLNAPLTYAKTAMSIDNTGVACTLVGGTVGGLSNLEAGEIDGFTYNAAGVAAFIAAQRAYFQRYYGTP